VYRFNFCFNSSYDGEAVMSEDPKTYDDEIDFFAFFEILWNGKWKIIITTFFAVLIGLVYSVYKPNSFKVSTPIEQGGSQALLTFTSLNNLLKENDLLFDAKKEHKWLSI
jgi:LPS O-antigen subunit length determinant protein (WzzB/FepE family)